MAWRSMPTEIYTFVVTRRMRFGELTTASQTLLAHDPWGIKLGRPTNLAFGGENFDEIYVANLARYTIARAKIGVRGQPLANMRGRV